MLAGIDQLTPFSLDLLISEVFLTVAKTRSAIVLSELEKNLVSSLADVLSRIRQAEFSTPTIPDGLVSSQNEREALEKAIASLPDDEGTCHVPVEILDEAISLLGRLTSSSSRSDSDRLLDCLRRIGDSVTPDLLSNRFG